MTTVAQLHFDVDGYQLLDKVEEDEGDLEVFDTVSTSTEDTHWLGCVSLHQGEVCLDAGREEGATGAADATPRLVTAVEQPILKQESGSVTQKGIPFHLSESDTTALLPTLYWLPCDAVNRTKTSHLELVRHHVSKPLVMDHPHENLCSHLNSRDTGVKGLRAVVVVSCGIQLLGKVVNGLVVWIFRECEGSCIMHLAMDGTTFSCH